MKKTFLISCSLLIISLLWLSCNKEEPIPPTIVNGQVLEQGSSKPLEGVKVVLMEGTFSGSSGTNSYHPIDTFLTDKEGKYSYEHKLAANGKSYQLWYFKDKYFDISSISNNEKTTYVKLNQSVNANVKLIPFAWVKMHIVNAKPFDSQDELYLAAPWESSYNDRIFRGKVDTTFTKKTRGGIKLSMFYAIDKAGKETKYQDTIIVKGLDTLLYQIRY